MSDRHELHNLLSERFVRDVLGPAIRNGASDAQLMVLFESCQLGLMLALHRHYGIRPDIVAALAEAAHHRALERFAREATP